jgi:hypothetical protein
MLHDAFILMQLRISSRRVVQTSDFLNFSSSDNPITTHRNLSMWKDDDIADINEEIQIELSWFNSIQLN